jgi:hypothetical protein
MGDAGVDQRPVTALAGVAHHGTQPTFTGN